MISSSLFKETNRHTKKISNQKNETIINKYGVEHISQLQEIKADKFSIGGIQQEEKRAFTNHKLITLIPGCDKNYRTCCYSFNNAVNFRGEPVIPDSNIIEN